MVTRKNSRKKMLSPGMHSLQKTMNMPVLQIGKLKACNMLLVHICPCNFKGRVCGSISMSHGGRMTDRTDIEQALVNGDQRFQGFFGLWALLEDRTSGSLAESIMLKTAITELIIGVHDRAPGRFLDILGNPPADRASARVAAIGNVFRALYSVRSSTSIQQLFRALHSNARQIVERCTPAAAAAGAEDAATEGERQESPCSATPDNEAQ
jgi:hypothetical protein